MADLQPPQREAARSSSPDGRPPIPRWVKVSALVAVVLLLLLLTAILLGGNHGPGRHFNNSSVRGDEQTESALWSVSGRGPDGESR